MRQEVVMAAERPYTSFKPVENTQFELRLVSIYKQPGTGDKTEGVVWAFGINSSQIDTLKISYPL